MCVHVAQFIYGPYGSLYSILKNPLKYKLEFICHKKKKGFFFQKKKKKKKKKK